MPIQSPASNIMKCDVGLTFISGLQTFQSTISQNIHSHILISDTKLLSACALFEQCVTGQLKL